MESQFFTLHWYHEKRGEFETNYQYTGSAVDYQDKYTFRGWVLCCIAAGKRAGLTYVGKDRRG